MVVNIFEFDFGTACVRALSSLTTIGSIWIAARLMIGEILRWLLRGLQLTILLTAKK
jgi:hypothetical protein